GRSLKGGSDVLSSCIPYHNTRSIRTEIGACGLSGPMCASQRIEDTMPAKKLPKNHDHAPEPVRSEEDLEAVREKNAPEEGVMDPDDELSSHPDPLNVEQEMAGEEEQVEEDDLVEEEEEEEDEDQDETEDEDGED